MTSRKKTSRSLRFESLETRKSLTSVTGFAAPAEVVAAEYASANVSANRLLLYVAALGNVDIHRDIPNQSDVDSVDQWIENTSPEE